MKLKVLRKFKDKNTGELYEAGSVIEVSDERGAEIIGNPLKLAEAVKTTTRRKSASKAAPKKKRGETE